MKLNLSRHSPPKEKLGFYSFWSAVGYTSYPLGLRCASVSPPFQPRREPLGFPGPNRASLVADYSDSCVIGKEKTAGADVRPLAAL